MKTLAREQYLQELLGFIFGCYLKHSWQQQVVTLLFLSGFKKHMDRVKNINQLRPIQNLFKEKIQILLMS